MVGPVAVTMTNILSVCEVYGRSSTVPPPSYVMWMSTRYSHESWTPPRFAILALRTSRPATRHSVTSHYVTRCLATRCFAALAPQHAALQLSPTVSWPDPPTQNVHGTKAALLLGKENRAILHFVIRHHVTRCLAARCFAALASQHAARQLSPTVSWPDPPTQNVLIGT